MDERKVKIQIEFEAPISAATRQWLEVDIKSFLHHKWRTYESVGNKENIKVVLIEE